MRRRRLALAIMSLFFILKGVGYAFSLRYSERIPIGISGFQSKMFIHFWGAVWILAGFYALYRLFTHIKTERAWALIAGLLIGWGFSFFSTAVLLPLSGSLIFDIGRGVEYVLLGITFACLAGGNDE